ncbi:MAG: MFS transporter [Bacteroides sp. SM1_62]|nr:MAG: MFS transporter [Bacteroides sp. SM1_62]
MTKSTNTTELSDPQRTSLFWACFIALTATSFGFAIRAMLITEWGSSFNLSKTQMGEIMGVGLWPFAVSIVLFSLIIDKIGYGKAMIFAFTCHIVSVIITIAATGYNMLYLGTFIFALGNGTIEATINPVVATLYKENKAKWMNILHAGWPGGMVISGILAMSMGPQVKWQLKIALLLIPMLLYGILLIGKKFPVHERVVAGISFKEMLKEVGIIGALIIISLMVFEVGNFFDASLLLKIIIIVIIVGSFGFYVRSPGRPLFIFLLLIMFPLATTELGTDSWIVDLMSKEMNQMGLQAGWILVYTAAIMTIFRSTAGPLLKIFKPVGLLIFCSIVAAIALFSLSLATGILIFVVATVYGFAKAYFWPTMIGIAGERFPRGGALTLNMITGVGMIGVGIVGAVFLGYVQDTETDRKILKFDQDEQTALHTEYVTLEKKSIFGKYLSLDMQKLESATEDDRNIVSDIQLNAQKSALKMVAILPLIMLVCFVILLLYFRSIGGYKSITLVEGET